MSSFDWTDTRNIILNREYIHPDNPICDCGNRPIAVVRTSYDRPNIGRRYYACGLFYEGIDCGFHQWMEPSGTKSAYDIYVVETLYEAYNEKCSQNVELTKCIDGLMDIVKKLKEEKEELILDAANMEFKVIIERIDKKKE
ncbi:hypothetical protein ACFE04_019522 [Oxalis oulophora]